MPTGELYFNADVVRQLHQHSSSTKSTYAYYFTERYDFTTDNPFLFLPNWLKRSAAHYDDIPFLFGAAFLEEESSPIWKGKILFILYTFAYRIFKAYN